MQFQLCENLDNVHVFLSGAATEENLCTPTRLSLLEVLDDKFKKEMLRLQLLMNAEVGKPLVNATYMLEGDGATAFVAYDFIAGIQLVLQRQLIRGPEPNHLLWQRLQATFQQNRSMTRP